MSKFFRWSLVGIIASSISALVLDAQASGCSYPFPC